MSMVFSQNSIYHLYKLGTLVTGKTGHRFALSNEKERMDLIHYCSQSKDQSIQRQMDVFIESLESHQLQQLEARQLISSGRILWQKHKVAS